ncbi:bifunctional [glutamate--ammonia ligase]-adenylyl-L-tyrosine phosphorylase/[glutamate--ammonia-ligase] adenylyltransferase [Lysobacter ciconiae]|uniref:Bifunctional glutamine synthetase adenylyltransferase/adenylyl-removing enzyme n=1 Tax=Novilysobacter ciconiae TaxID=2781022 RepID=A0A7S6ZSM3_9GAMM|nr:bifunctional [glutamate--ammonia ligase]-adenylyl-L-tyrosine phosphorylase/[glutamate--ammonia-ligase] adenylyltransferase [Lysobacter ciconiae]QOW19849.1 bifunctional [glutamate--ammonia ligase]-adenylyl-L-tyrosine phosphorylase/[glutamate--ammonia-ligase] adenylyltransferase [Lysobacter ciconiae]
MTPPQPIEPAVLLRQLEPAGIAELDDSATARLQAVAIASDFAIDTFARQPGLLDRLLQDDGAVAMPPPELDHGAPEAWPSALRLYRAAESTRLVWRDVLGLDGIDTTLAGTTMLAERCQQLALDALESSFIERHGVLRDAAGSVLRLVVLALGKLGGGELNFSSDVDLVYGYEPPGDPAAASDGPRPLAAEHYFSRLGQKLARLLDDVTVDGFCHRVDLRLRPYGNAGRVAWSFPAMEQYFQREGRDWERYAWQKARPVAGDLAAGTEFLELLRPFVYRRYLDYGALDGLRAMKAAIAAEVARKELADDIKRGPGGIREIEFLAQALQLIRGGRDPDLRERSLQPALAALVKAGQVEARTGAQLTEAYRFLRHLENRLQMFADQQTHALPVEPTIRERIAIGMGFADWDELRVELERHRGIVAEEFAALLAPRHGNRSDGTLAEYWLALPDGGDAAVLAEAGFEDASSADSLLRDFARSPGVVALTDATRARLDRVLPAFMEGAARSSRPALALRRLLALVQNILRRTAYLALLDEQPAALARLVRVTSQSALLAERVAVHPLLLDELLDASVAGELPGRAELIQACAQVGLQGDGSGARRAPGHGGRPPATPEVRSQEDVEAVLNALNEVRQAASFRIAMAHRDHRQPAVDSARQVAWLAEGVVNRVLAMATREMLGAHGELPATRFAVFGYGSLGGEELGFDSDLDLVFLYDTPARAGGIDAVSDGPRPLDAARWSARLAQKLVALLEAPTRAGRLYEVDVRLRPDGAKGVLVSSLASFAAYQRERAWNWEHQALVRARAIAGDPTLAEDFAGVRTATLSRPRDPDQLRDDVSAMRARMRAELDRSKDGVFDLKQGQGGLVDLEFVLQSLVLEHAASRPEVLGRQDTHGLIVAVHEAGIIDEDTRTQLQAAHEILLSRSLDCSLDRRPRRMVPDAPVARARAAIELAAREHGLDFSRRL